MEIISTLAGWEFLLRFVHFLAGVCWIGVLWYFNLIQTPFFGTELGGQAKSAITRGLVPNALWWFRWGAMFTFLSGWFIVLMKLHSGIGLGDGYMTRVLTGGLMGTLMWANVWFVIWPAQKIVIANAENVAAGGEANPEAAARAGRAGMASRTNTLFSIPMLFFMGSASHLPWFNAGSSDMAYWLIAGLIILFAEAQALIGPGSATQKPLTSVSGTIHAGLGLTLILFLVGAIVNS
ncbi:MAG: urate hydroxylase PuuD [Deltaproteobacteria bacterium]|nr:urate hydroxylase PuuD [Deltaproteobacteria bacterium]MBW2694951.1 urate hydroxylase PuuD [Deltaproteobacteria bacterium]